MYVRTFTNKQVVSSSSVEEFISTSPAADELQRPCTLASVTSATLQSLVLSKLFPAVSPFDNVRFVSFTSAHENRLVSRKSLVTVYPPMQIFFLAIQLTLKVGDTASLRRKMTSIISVAVFNSRRKIHLFQWNVKTAVQKLGAHAQSNWHITHYSCSASRIIQKTISLSGERNSAYSY